MRKSKLLSYWPHRYRHAQLSAVKLAGDLNAKMEAASLDEILEQIKVEMIKLGPLIDLDAIREAQGADGYQSRRAGTKLPQSHGARGELPGA